MTLTFHTVNQFFCMTLWPMIMHNHIRFGNKMFSGSEVIMWTNMLNLCCDLDLEHSNTIFPQDTPAFDAVLSNQVWLQTDQKFRRHSKSNYILIIEAHVVTLTFKIVNQFFCKTHCLMIIHHQTKLGKKKVFLNSWAVQEMINGHDQTHRENTIQTNIHWHSKHLLWPWPWAQ